MQNTLRSFICGSVIIAAANAAQATVVVDPAEGSYTFAGTLSHTFDSVSVTCTWSVTADVSGAGTSQANIEITSVTTTGGLFSGCRNYDFTTPWYWTAPASSFGTSATSTTQVLADLTDVEFAAFFGGSCIGTVPDVKFANAVSSTDTRSYLYIDGEVGTSGCELNGTLYAETDVNIYD